MRYSEELGEIMKRHNRIRLEAELKIAKAEFEIAKANLKELHDLEVLTRKHKERRCCDDQYCTCDNCSDSYED